MWRNRCCCFPNTQDWRCKLILQVFTNMAWAAIHGDQYDQLVLPEFNGASVLPPKELSFPNHLELIPNQRLTTRRFVFDLTKIASLKAKIGGTQVQLVSAIIYLEKCSYCFSWIEARDYFKHNSPVANCELPQ